MFDARIFLDQLDDARKILKENHAVFKGEYSIHDIIYASKDSNKGIDKFFMRLRFVPKDIWNDKPFIVSIKHTELKNIGKQSVISVKEQFDTEIEARDFIEKNYSKDFYFLYEFDRIGWQYDLSTDQIDLEEIEGLYSIEFKSKTEKGLKELLDLFKIKKVINGPSVVAIKNLLGR